MEAALCLPYIEPFAAFHPLVDGHSLASMLGEISAKHKTAEHCSPSHYLALVLKALPLLPFKPMRSAGLRELSLLLALASAKPVGDMYALSIDPACLLFGPNECNVMLKPKVGNVPKSLSTQFSTGILWTALLAPFGESCGLFMSLVERGVYPGHLYGSWLVFAEYVRQILQS